MKTRELYEQTFTPEALEKAELTDDMRHWIFAIGVQEGMRQAAKLLDGEWFKTQKDCAEAIRTAAGRL